MAATLTGGHRNDVTQLLPLIDGIGAVGGKRGRPRRRPDRVIADRGYDHDKYRRELWRRGVQPRIARRGTEHGSGLDRVRWVVERTFAWLHNFRRLRIRWRLSRKGRGVRAVKRLAGMAQNFLVCDREQPFLVPPDVRDWL